MADQLDYAWDSLCHFGVDPDDYDDVMAELDEDEPPRDEDEPMAYCPQCDGEAEPLGTLGRLEHWRCQDCHTIFEVPHE